MEARSNGVRQVVATMVDSTGLEKFLSRLNNSHDVAITFHQICAQLDEVQTFQSCPVVPASFFRECVRYFTQRYEVVPLPELVKRKRQSRRPRVAITFDD